MKTKQLFILAFATLAFAFTGCLKSDIPAGTPSNCVSNNTGTPTQAEITSLQTYITNNNLTATQHSGGFFYNIVNPGAGATPTLSSTVTVKYTGSLQNGTVFDQNTTGATFALSQLILGWQRGLPLIQKGGSIILYLPPTLAYGCNNVPGIPPGSNTIFSIELIQVQ